MASAYKEGRLITNCPNCGAAFSGSECPYCGTIFYDFACIDTEKPFWMKIKTKDGTVRMFKVALVSNTAKAEPPCVYADNVPIFYFNESFYRTVEMEFLIL